MWIVWLLLVILYIVTGRIIYYAHKKSKELGVTEYTNKAFYEPIVNLLFLGGVLLIIGFLDWIF
jgi:cytochrome c biogenesis factor